MLRRTGPAGQTESAVRRCRGRRGGRTSTRSAVAPDLAA